MKKYVIKLLNNQQKTFKNSELPIYFKVPHDDDELVDFVAFDFETTGVDFESDEAISFGAIHFTYNVSIGAIASINKTLEQLRELGIHIAIDDLGTGYSSLAYLTQLPFDALKVDRSFVAQMLESKSHTAIIAAIVTITNVFNAEIVAEGVETAEQAQRLKQLGCRYAQGLYYSRPKPLAEWATENTQHKTLNNYG